MEATAKYDFNATADDDLSFRKGEQLKILQTTGNWYKADLNGVEGYVPQNFINIHLPSWYQGDLNRTDAEHKLMLQPVGAFLIRGSQNAAPGDFSISVRHPADVQHFKVMRNRRGQYYLWTDKFPSLNQLVEHYKNNSISKQGHVFLQEMQPEQRHGSEHLPPLPAPPPSGCPTLPAPRQQRRSSDYVPPLPASVPSGCPPLPAPRQTALCILVKEENPNHSKHKASSTLQVRALYNFHAEEEDELEFNAGDVIKVLDSSEEAWWRGELRGKTGLFPSNHTERI